MNFFEDDESERGPAISRELIAHAERTLGVRLPAAYLELLTQRNGGTPRRRCVRTQQPTSWARDHFEVRTLLGIGYDDGIDGAFGSEYMTQEWGYPPRGVVIFDTPSAGHDTVMLDYSLCGPTGEPRVIYVDDDRRVVPVAESFRELVSKLEPCASLGG